MILNTEAMSNEEKFDKGTDLLQAWYNAEIRELAEEYTKLIKSGEIEDSDELNDRIVEDTDGHAFVIYTYKAQAVCFVSDSSSAYEDEIGEKPATVEAQACMAMRADIWEALGDVDEIFEARDAEKEKADE